MVSYQLFTEEMSDICSLLNLIGTPASDVNESRTSFKIHVKLSSCKDKLDSQKH